ncbi:MAG: OB-fold nucleic acid binding domain-containing protein [Thermoleophilia bacterium]|nr:OB-fold nucleic acid binding domain-containing protein [Thermoleophilia bacterium]
MSYELPALGDEVPVLVAGVYERAQNPWMRSGRRTMFLTLEDAYGLFECVVFEPKLAKYAPVVARATYFLVRGRLQNNRKRGLAIVVEEIRDLEEVLAKMGRRAGENPEGRAGATSGRRPARLGQIEERPTYAEHKLLVAERKQARVSRELEVYGLGTADERARPPGGGDGGYSEEGGVRPRFNEVLCIHCSETVPSQPGREFRRGQHREPAPQLEHVSIPAHQHFGA